MLRITVSAALSLSLPVKLLQLKGIPISALHLSGLTSFSVPFDAIPIDVHLPPCVCFALGRSGNSIRGDEIPAVLTGFVSAIAVISSLLSSSRRHSLWGESEPEQRRRELIIIVRHRSFA